MIKLTAKICLVGDFAVGKTSLVRRFVYDRFDDRYLSTIGVKVSRKVVTVEHRRGTVEATMMLWDLAGGEEFSLARASYLRGAAGAVLVCDVTRPETLDSLMGYAADLAGAGVGPRLVVAANKCDLTGQEQLAPEQVREMAAALGAPCYMTSAKTGAEVEAVFAHLGRLLADAPPEGQRGRQT